MKCGHRWRAPSSWFTTLSVTHLIRRLLISAYPMLQPMSVFTRRAATFGWMVINPDDIIDTLVGYLRVHIYTYLFHTPNFLFYSRRFKQWIPVNKKKIDKVQPTQQTKRSVANHHVPSGMSLKFSMHCRVGQQLRDADGGTWLTATRVWRPQSFAQCLKLTPTLVYPRRRMFQWRQVRSQRY
jgi:hypothetical protein